MIQKNFYMGEEYFNFSTHLYHGTWEKPGSEGVREVVGTHSVITYIGRRQTTMAEWVALRPLYEVCAKEKGYEGGGRRREAWWRQEATEKQLWATLAGISQEDKRRRQLGERVTQ